MTKLKEIEGTDSMHRDLALPGTLTVLGRIALVQDDLEAARTSFSQAITQLKARPKGPGLGHVLIQACAGLAQVNKEEKAFDEAVAAFEDREIFDYSWAPTCWDGASLLELYRAAMAIAHTGKAREFLVKARTAGSDEARREPMP
jgi:hypothetical protein